MWQSLWNTDVQEEHWYTGCGKMSTWAQGTPKQFGLTKCPNCQKPIKEKRSKYAVKAIHEKWQQYQKQLEKLYEDHRERERRRQKQWREYLEKNTIVAKHTYL